MSDKKTKYITFRTTEEIKNALEAEAKELDRPLSWLINKIISEYENTKVKNEKNIHIEINHNENINL